MLIAYTLSVIMQDSVSISISDDFAYSNNVKGATIGVRLGELALYGYEYQLSR